MIDRLSLAQNAGKHAGNPSVTTDIEITIAFMVICAIEKILD